MNMGQGGPASARIREALMHDWDPIGVREIPEAADEYDAYVAELRAMLVQGRSEAELFEYLWELETEHMGLQGDRIATRAFAKQLAAMDG